MLELNGDGKTATMRMVFCLTPWRGRLGNGRFHSERSKGVNRRIFGVQCGAPLTLGLAMLAFVDGFFALAVWRFKIE